MCCIIKTSVSHSIGPFLVEVDVDVEFHGGSPVDPYVCTTWHAGSVVLPRRVHVPKTGVPGI